MSLNAFVFPFASSSEDLATRCASSIGPTAFPQAAVERKFSSSEDIGYSYSQLHAISVIVARIGWCPRPGQEDEIHSTDWAQDIYLSPGDAGRFFASCICAPDHVRHLVVNVTSIPRNLERIDLTVAREVLGYRPQETYPTGMNSPAQAS